ncbi:hypothetical protein HOB10_00905 [Candidatus Parcubacteria bacterium]|nr:hypothetical protein [Candidatus Parcubacteria bacterium]
MPNHVESSIQRLQEDNVRIYLWQMLRTYSDNTFQDRVDLLIFQKKPGFFQRVHKMSHLEYATFMMSHARDIILLAETQIRAIYAVLAPIYFAMGSELPQVTGEDIDAILEHLPPDDFLDFFEQFAEYDTGWFTTIAAVTDLVDRQPAKAAVWAICKTFMDKLPEPIEKG